MDSAPCSLVAIGRRVKLRKTANRKSRIFPNENVVKNSAKVRVLTMGIGGYLTSSRSCLFFGRCWAGCIQFWIIYLLSLGVETALSEGPSKTNGVAKGVAKNGVGREKEKRVTAL
jgi:hypothetical protein